MHSCVTEYLHTAKNDLYSRQVKSRVSKMHKKYLLQFTLYLSRNCVYFLFLVCQRRLFHSHGFHALCGTYRILTLFCTSASQPASNSSRQLWLWPFWQHKWRAVKPPQFLAFRLALALANSETVWLKPFHAASWRAELPCCGENGELGVQWWRWTWEKILTTLSAELTSAPCLISSLTISRWPSADAIWIAV